MTTEPAQLPTVKGAYGHYRVTRHDSELRRLVFTAIKQDYMQDWPEDYYRPYFEQQLRDLFQGIGIGEHVVIEAYEERHSEPSYIRGRWAWSNRTGFIEGRFNDQGAVIGAHQVEAMCPNCGALTFAADYDGGTYLDSLTCTTCGHSEYSEYLPDDTDDQDDD